MTHKFTYKHSKSEISTTIEVNEDTNLSTLIEAFETYLKACEYVFDGRHIELVEDAISTEYMAKYKSPFED